jgi:hypothetical protein
MAELCRRQTSQFQPPLFYLSQEFCLQWIEYVRFKDWLIQDDSTQAFDSTCKRPTFKTPRPSSWLLQEPFFLDGYRRIISHSTWRVNKTLHYLPFKMKTSTRRRSFEDMFLPRWTRVSSYNRRCMKLTFHSSNFLVRDKEDTAQVVYQEEPTSTSTTTTFGKQPQWERIAWSRGSVKQIIHQSFVIHRVRPTRTLVDRKPVKLWSMSSEG